MAAETQARGRNENDKHAGVSKGIAPRSVEPTRFKMKARLLEQGRTNTPLARTGNMWATLKVYASGGENTLHTHPNEDHMFVIMQGRARFYGAKGKETDLGRNEGIMLPAGAYYWFKAIGDEPLVLLRVGARANRKDPADRRNIMGKAMPGNSRENKRRPVIYRDDAYFE